MWTSLRTHLLKQVTPSDLRNIRTTGSSCGDALPCTNMVLKQRSLLVATSTFSLLTIRQHSATRQHLFSYPQGDRSDLRKPKKDEHQHLSQLPPGLIWLSQPVSTDLTVKPDSVLTSPIRKDWVQNWSM